MLSVYDLYDLHAIYTGIRFLPSNEINEAIVQKTILVLKNRQLKKLKKLTGILGQINYLNSLNII